MQPDARVDLIADAGHWVQYERPAETNRALLDFMLLPSEPPKWRHGKTEES